MDSQLIAACAVLVVFGIGYNWLVALIEREGYDLGYVSMLVVGGVLMTLGAYAALRGLDAALEIGLLFAASGTPMIIGSISRYAQQRRKMDDRLREWVSGNTQDHLRL